MPGEEDRERVEVAGPSGAEEARIASELDEAEDEGGKAGAGGAAGVAAQALPGAASSVSKADSLNRTIARFIDILIALLLARLPGYIGVLSGLTYIGIADGLMGGRSPGKRIIGLRVLYRDDRRNGDFRASILRNSTIGVLYLVFHIPFVGWALAILGLGFELLLMIGSPEGMRLGDEVAGTIVADESKK
jgi:uncharacterized RDD family membrane protein YckC